MQPSPRRVHFKAIVGHLCFCQVVLVISSSMKQRLAFAYSVGRPIFQRLHRLSIPTATKLCPDRIRRPQGSDLIRMASSSQAFLNSQTTGCKMLFDLELPEGRCVGVQLENSHDFVSKHAMQMSHGNHWLWAQLHPQEIAYGMEIPSGKARQSFFLGRLAMRRALDMTYNNSTLSSCILLKDEYGRPIVPAGYLGSISHKGSAGVALVAKDVPAGGRRLGIGVDIERSVSRSKTSVARRVLTLREQEGLGLVEVSYWRK
jgi:4'-phosphopantetheinyl transferase N-terminal domain